MDFPGLLAQLLNGVQYGLLLFLHRQRADADLRRHGHHQSRPRLAVHDRRLRGFPGRPAVGLGVAGPAGRRRRPASRWALVLERGLFRHFYAREHLDQVLLTFALILLFEEARSLLVGNDFYSVPVPSLLDFSVPITAGLQLFRLSLRRHRHLPRACRC